MRFRKILPARGQRVPSKFRGSLFGFAVQVEAFRRLPRKIGERVDLGRTFQRLLGMCVVQHQCGPVILGVSHVVDKVGRVPFSVRLHGTPLIRF